MGHITCLAQQKQTQVQHLMVLMDEGEAVNIQGEIDGFDLLLRTQSRDRSIGG